MRFIVIAKLLLIRPASIAVTWLGLSITRGVCPCSKRKTLELSTRKSAEMRSTAGHTQAFTLRSKGQSTGARTLGGVGGVQPPTYLEVRKICAKPLINFWVPHPEYTQLSATIYQAVDSCQNAPKPTVWTLVFRNFLRASLQTPILELRCPSSYSTPYPLTKTSGLAPSQSIDMSTVRAYSVSVRMDEMCVSACRYNCSFFHS